MLSLDPRPSELKPRLLTTQAHLGKGIPDLYEETRLRLRTMRESGRLAEHRERQTIAEVTRLVTSSVSAEIERAMSEDRALKKTVAEVKSGDLDPYTAAERITTSLWRR